MEKGKLFDLQSSHKSRGTNFWLIDVLGRNGLSKMCADVQSHFAVISVAVVQFKI